MDLFLRPELKGELTGSILYYAILDMINTQQASAEKDIIPRDFNTFSSIINMDTGLSNYICGCWYLDNGYGSEAIEIFLSSTCWNAISIRHWQQILTIFMSENMEKEALMFLSLPVPPTDTPAELNVVIACKLGVYLANRKCRECWLLLRTVRSNAAWEGHFRIFVRGAIQNNLKRDLLTLPLTTLEKQIMFNELKESPDYQAQTELLRVCKVFHGVFAGNGEQVSRRLNLKSPTVLASSPLRDVFTPIEWKKSEQFDETNELFSSPSILKIREMRKEILLKTPVVITPSSPSHSLIKKTDEPSQEIDDEVSMRPDDATRRSIRFVSESTSVDPNNSNEQMEVDEQSNHDEQSDTSTRTEKSQNDLTDETEESCGKHLASPVESEQAVLIIDSDDEQVDEPEADHKSECLFDTEDIKVMTSVDDDIAIVYDHGSETGQTSRPITPENEMIQNDHSIYESPQAETKIESDSEDVQEVIEIADDSITPPEEETNELLSNDTIISADPVEPFDEAIQADSDVEQISDNEADPEIQPESVEHELIQEDVFEQESIQQDAFEVEGNGESDATSNSAVDDPETLLARISNMPFDEVKSHYLALCPSAESSIDETDEMADFMRLELTSRLTCLVEKIKLNLQEDPLQSEAVDDDEGEDSEGLSDDVNADEEHSETESEVPSVRLTERNPEIEFRKQSVSSIKVIRRDVRREMGDEVAEAVADEFRCVDSEKSDDEVIDEKPVILENTYDGDREESNDEDSVKSEMVEIGSERGSLDEEDSGQMVVGSPIRKDTSMDGERMTVSDSDGTIMDPDDRLSSIKNVRLMQNANMLISADECHSGVDSPVPNFHMKVPLREAKQLTKTQSIIHSENIIHSEEIIPTEGVSNDNILSAENTVQNSTLDVTNGVGEQCDMTEDSVICPDDQAEIHDQAEVQTIVEHTLEDIVTTPVEAVITLPETIESDSENVQEVIEINDDSNPPQPSVVHAVDDDSVIDTVDTVAAEPDILSAPIPQFHMSIQQANGYDPSTSETSEIADGTVDNLDLSDDQSVVLPSNDNSPIPTFGYVNPTIEDDPITTDGVTSRSKLEELRDSLDALTGDALKDLHIKYVGKAFSGAITKTTLGLIRKKIKNKLTELLSDMKVEGTGNTSKEPSAASTRQANRNKRGNSEQKEKKPYTRPRRYSLDNLSDDSKSVNTNDSTGSVATTRRSSRIRQRSGESEPESEPNTQLANSLKVVSENEVTLFSPPRRKSGLRDQPLTEGEEVSDEIPNFHFTFPRVTRKRSVDETGENIDSPAKKSKKSQLSQVRTPTKTPTTPKENLTPLRRSTRQRTLRQPKI